MYRGPRTPGSGAGRSTQARSPSGKAARRSPRRAAPRGLGVGGGRLPPRPHLASSSSSRSRCAGHWRLGPAGRQGLQEEAPGWPPILPPEVQAASDGNPSPDLSAVRPPGTSLGGARGPGNSQPLGHRQQPQRDFLAGDSPLRRADSPPRPVSRAVRARLGLQPVLEGRGARGSPAPPGRPHPRWGPGSRVLRGLLAAGAGGVAERG